MLSKKTLKWVFIIVGGVIVLAVLIYFFRCSLFNLDSCVEDPNKNNEPVPPGSSSAKWVPESFPLTLGMYGAKIKAMQAVLGFTGSSLDGKLGPITQGAITAKGYAFPLSQADYNSLIASGGASAASTLKGAYAKYNNTIVRNKDLSQKQVFNKDQWMGTITGTDPTGNYYELDGMYYVIKSSTYIKG